MCGEEEKTRRNAAAITLILYYIPRFALLNVFIFVCVPI